MGAADDGDTARRGVTPRRTDGGASAVHPARLSTQGRGWLKGRRPSRREVPRQRHRRTRGGGVLGGDGGRDVPRHSPRCDRGAQRPLFIHRLAARAVAGPRCGQPFGVDPLRAGRGGALGSSLPGVASPASGWPGAMATHAVGKPQRGSRN
ncbi:hypothetical protein T492DRAFT_1103039 [Pavlovales sp. CCMP2436]|nr:hypothetical protein T492DRAFT_1103039 [Pavlovales sp. CCMP2436]